MRRRLCWHQSSIWIHFVVLCSVCVQLSYSFIQQQTHCPRDSVSFSSNNISLSLIDCTGDTPYTRRCVFENVFVSRGIIWLVSDTAIEPPLLLCSAVTNTKQHAKFCQFRVATRSEVLRAILSNEVSLSQSPLSAPPTSSSSSSSPAPAAAEPPSWAPCIRGVRVALAVGRLARANCYHSLFEDLVPVYETLTLHPLLFSDWLRVHDDDDHDDAADATATTSTATAIATTFTATTSTATMTTTSTSFASTRSRGRGRGRGSHQGTRGRGGGRMSMSQYPDMVIFVEDEHPDHDSNHYTHRFWRQFFPRVLQVDRFSSSSSSSRSSSRSSTGEVFFVESLVAGSNSSCVHYYHCRRGAYTTPGIAMAFRRFLLAKVGISLAAQELADQFTPSSAAAAAAVEVVTIIQRQPQESRQLLNIQDLLSICNSVFGGKASGGGNSVSAHAEGGPCVVKYYSEMSLRAQILQTHASDVLIAVHGGSLGNILFAKNRSTVIDIYPYSFPYSFHGLMNWIRFSLMDSLFIGHAPLEVQRAEDMFFKNKTGLSPLSPCLCNTSTRLLWFKCGFGKMFYRSAGMYIDPVRFSDHLKSALSVWQQRQVHASVPAAVDPPPVSRGAFKVFSLSQAEPWYYARLRSDSSTASFRFPSEENNSNSSNINSNNSNINSNNSNINSNINSSSSSNHMISDGRSGSSREDATARVLLPDCSDHVFFRPSRRRGGQQQQQRKRKRKID
jgi:hypothetical protein